MYRTSIEAEAMAMGWLEFSLREITGKWVSREGMPQLRIFRNETRKGGCYYLELTYKNPHKVYSRPIKKCFRVRYIDLYGYLGVAYDAGRDVLLLSDYGEYFREQE